METISVNAMGEPCPLPVIKATRVLEGLTGPGALEVLVDNDVAVQNLLRLAAGRHLPAVSQKLGEGRYSVRIQAGEVSLPAPEQADPPACRPDARGDYVVAVSSAAMGTGDDELGRTLMKGFLYALTQLETLPRAILFYNGGAALTTQGSPSLEDLRTLEAQGVEILTCGTCLSFYGLTERLAVGSVTNMYDIAQRLTGTRVVRP